MHNFHKKIYHLFSVTIYGWHSKYSFSMLVAAAVEVNMYYRRKTGSKFCLKCAKIKILGFKKIHINFFANHSVLCLTQYWMTWGCRRRLLRDEGRADCSPIVWDRYWSPRHSPATLQTHKKEILCCKIEAWIVLGRCWLLIARNALCIVSNQNLHNAITVAANFPEWP